MINGGEKVLAVIPARGGSKGVPRKNLRELGGEPLIAWTIRAALSSTRIDCAAVSSEDPEILRVARDYGCDTLIERPSDLAGDSVTVASVVCHAARSVGTGYDWLLVLQPTTPFRGASAIDGFLGLAERRGADAAMSVAPVDKSPYWCFTLSGESRLEPVLRGNVATQRQGVPATYAPNGAMYLRRLPSLIESGVVYADGMLGFRMDRVSSIDIDTELDFRLAECVLEAGDVPDS